MEVDVDRQVIRGKVLFVRDLVTYECQNATDIKAAFESAVDDYLDTCAELGREPERPFSGLLQVRLSAALHREVAVRAATSGASINAVIVSAVDEYLKPKSRVNNFYFETSRDNGVGLSMNTANPSTTNKWVQAHVRH